jgi:hypothetical protein
MQVQRNGCGQTARIRRPYYLLILIDDAEGESVTPFERVSKIESSDERKPSPRDEAIRSPRQKRVL